MLTTFEEMPPQARIWVYQANHRLTHQEIEFIESKFFNMLEL